MQNLWLTLFFCFSALIQTISAQFCIMGEQETLQTSNIDAKSINDLKTIRVNFHYLLPTIADIRNFTETGDNYNNSQNGYTHAQKVVDEMNAYAGWNEQMYIPPGNTTPVIEKKYRYVLDAVYFPRNDDTLGYFNSGTNFTSSYNLLGKDKDSVFNTFYVYAVGNGAFASSISPNSLLKFSVSKGLWRDYVVKLSAGYPIEWHWHVASYYTNHENGHLLGLSHTVKKNNGPACPTGCPGSTPIDYNCTPDNCADTPNAWDITALPGNNCTQHPDCGWLNNFSGSTVYCSNNIMDYGGANALTPCQINIIHSSLEGGLRSYNACAAVNTDKTYCDLGYPRVSYFGRNISVGTCGTLANITSKEQLAAYYSGEVVLNNFEIASDATFEIVYQATCGF